MIDTLNVGGSPIQFNVVTYKAGSPELLDKNLVMKFGEEPMSALNGHWFNLIGKEETVYTSDKAIEFAKNKMLEMLNGFQEQAEKESAKFDSDNLPLVVLVKWADKKFNYAYATMYMSVVLWNMLVSKTSTKAKFKKILSQTFSKKALQAAGKMSATTIGSASIVKPLNDFIGNKLRAGMEHRKWKKQELERIKNGKLADRRDKELANDPFYSIVGRPTLPSGRGHDERSPEVRGSDPVLIAAGADFPTVKAELIKNYGSNLFEFRGSGNTAQKFDETLVAKPSATENAAKRKAEEYIRSVGGKPYFFAVSYNRGSEGAGINVLFYIDQKTKNLINQLQGQRSLPKLQEGKERLVVTLSELKRLLLETL